jgi:hypothetical protein
MLEYLESNHFSLPLHRAYRQELERWFGREAVNFHDDISVWLYDELSERHQGLVTFEAFHSQLLAVRDADPDPDDFMSQARDILWETIGYLEHWFTEEYIRDEFKDNQRLRAIYHERL